VCWRSRHEAGRLEVFRKGAVRIYYEEAGSGFPLLLIPGGGLNSTIAFFTGNSPFNAIEEFKRRVPLHYARTCATRPPANPRACRSRPALGVVCRRSARPDGSFGHRQVHGDGFLHRRPVHLESVEARAQSHAGRCAGAAGRLASRDARRRIIRRILERLAGADCAKRPKISLETAEQFVDEMFETNPDFVFTVTRDFVRTCQTPILVLPDEVPAHPYAVAMECAMLAPKAEVSIFPWKEPKERIPLAVRQIHSFLRGHRSA
jgi:hypothetical protein